MPLRHQIHIPLAMRSVTRISVALVACICLFFASNTASAQLQHVRIGLGFQTLLTTDDGLGFGFRGRLSAPVNSDLSFAFDLGASGFILDGRDNATYIFDPQVSAIISFPGSTDRAAYILAGVGGYIPFKQNDRRNGGPTLHLGVGWVRPLRETTLFYEINPALIIKRDAISVAFPFRIGIIL